jgi:hypothetical protein
MLHLCAVWEELTINDFALGRYDAESHCRNARVAQLLGKKRKQIVATARVENQADDK